MLRYIQSKFRLAGLSFARNEGGALAIEFAIVASVLIALIVGALELFVIVQAQSVLETSAETVGRQVLTGIVQSQGLSQSQFHTLVCNAIPALMKCSGVMVDVQVASSFANANTSAPTITYDAQNNVTNTWQYQPGAPQDIVVLRVMYLWPTIRVPGFNLANQPNGNMLLMATAVFKNESFQ
jgi:Flp pilus assembly protein TadG